MTEQTIRVPMDITTAALLFVMLLGMMFIAGYFIGLADGMNAIQEVRLP